MPQQVIQKSEPAVPPGESVKQVSEAVSPKIDFATDLFNMLSADDPTESGSEAPSTDDDLWAGFQCMSKIFLLCFTLSFEQKSLLQCCDYLLDMYSPPPTLCVFAATEPVCCEGGKVCLFFFGVGGRGGGRRELILQQILLRIGVGGV